MLSTVDTGLNHHHHHHHHHHRSRVRPCSLVWASSNSLIRGFFSKSSSIWFVIQHYFLQCALLHKTHPHLRVVSPALYNETLGTESQLCKCSIFRTENAAEYACTEVERWQTHQRTN